MTALYFTTQHEDEYNDTDSESDNLNVSHNSPTLGSYKDTVLQSNHQNVPVSYDLNNSQKNKRTSDKKLSKIYHHKSSDVEDFSEIEKLVSENIFHSINEMNINNNLNQPPKNNFFLN